MAVEIQLLICGYSAQCTVRGCRARELPFSPGTPIAKDGRLNTASCASATRTG